MHRRAMEFGVVILFASPIFDLIMNLIRIDLGRSDEFKGRAAWAVAIVLVMSYVRKRSLTPHQHARFEVLLNRAFWWSIGALFLSLPFVWFVTLPDHIVTFYGARSSIFLAFPMLVSFALYSSAYVRALLAPADADVALPSDHP